MSTNSEPGQYSEHAPRVFIGSSSEALDLARRIRDELKSGQELEVKTWDEVLRPGEMLLDGLRRLVNLYDFGIMVLGADDIVQRGEERGRTRTPRDNVIFELGLFMGVLGRKRALPIIVRDRAGAALKLPSDLAGLNYTELHLDKIGDSTYFNGKVATVREDIKRRFRNAPLSLLPSTSLASGYFNNFLIPVKKGLDELTEPVKKGLDELTEKEIEDGTFLFNNKKEIEDGKYIFRILYPQSASGASVVNRGERVKKLGLRSVSVKHAGRSYPFFAYPERDAKGRILLADYPTTLRSSCEAIDLAFPEGERGEFKEEKEQLEKKEVANFIKTLKRLLEDTRDLGEDFPARIEFRQDRSEN
jgi:Predicted nucleotide-binding protein containing TIR-like domain